LAPDQIQEHVEGPLEGLEEHLERLRRDIQVARHLGHRLAFHHGKRHFALFRRQRYGNRRRIVRHQRQFRLHR